MGSPWIAAKVAGIVVSLAAAAPVTLTHAAEPGAAIATRALNADLLAHDSATEVLRRWCASRRLADPPLIKAVRETSAEKPADRQTRALLQVRANEPVRYRRVRLVCGSHTLSKADNWYVPDRLTPDMNRQLDQTETPFGFVVKPLGYHRIRLVATILLDRYGQAKAGQGVLQHKALLVTPEGLPFSFVVETYTSDIATINPAGR